MTGAVSAQQRKLICCAGLFSTNEVLHNIEKALFWLLFVSESENKQSVCEATSYNARAASLKACLCVRATKTETEAFCSAIFSFGVIHLKISVARMSEGSKAPWLFVQPSVSHQCSQSGSSVGHLSPSKSTSF